MKTKHILIVDDSPFFIRLIQEYLSRSDFEVLNAKDGHEALQIVDKNPPGLILMDLNMEGLDGVRCCRHIKSNPVTAGIPVIMLTSAGKEEDKEKCKEAGCDDYLTKPIDRGTLLNKIKQFIDIPIREYERAPIYSQAVYYFDNQQYSGIIHAISENGLFIKGEKILDRGSKVKIVFDIADISAMVEVLAEVVWSTNEKEQTLSSPLVTGFGVRFKSISEENMEDIRIYISLGKYLV